jgi:hypothetical protein
MTIIKYRHKDNNRWLLPRLRPQLHQATIKRERKVAKREINQVGAYSFELLNLYLNKQFT